MEESDPQDTQTEEVPPNDQLNVEESAETSAETPDQVQPDDKKSQTSAIELKQSMTKSRSGAAIEEQQPQAMDSGDLSKDKPASDTIQKSEKSGSDIDKAASVTSQKSGKPEKSGSDIAGETPETQEHEATKTQSKEDDIERNKSDFAVKSVVSFDTEESKQLDLDAEIPASADMTLDEVEELTADDKYASQSNLQRRASEMKGRVSFAVPGLQALLEEPEPAGAKRKRKMSGDFLIREDLDFDADTFSDTNIGFADIPGEAKEEGEEEGEKSESTIEEPEEEPILLNRTPYYERFKAVCFDHHKEKLRNNFLQKKMAEYFKKRHMDHVLREHAGGFDSAQKYDKLLLKLDELLEVKQQQTTVTMEELSELKGTRDKELAGVNKTIQNLLSRERDIGIGLINRKTGNPIPDRQVEYFIRRQTYKIKELSELRHKFIRIRNMVFEKLERLKEIEIIDEGCTLHYYLQLKLDNRTRADKIELKDNEMIKLRYKCRNTIQVLAHIREKLAAMTLDMDELNGQREETEMDLIVARERLASFKIERDMFRKGYHKLKDNAGLLTRPGLLMDFENSIHEAERIKLELLDLKKETFVKTEEVRKVRKELEQFKQMKKMKAPIRPTSSKYKKTTFRKLSQKPSAAKQEIIMRILKPGCDELSTISGDLLE